MPKQSEEQTTRKERKAFILFVLNNLFQHFNCYLSNKSGDRFQLTYVHSGTTVIAVNTTFEEILDFCAIKGLAYKYMWMPEIELFGTLTECAYFNYRVFMENKSDLYKAAKAREVGSTFSRFMGYLIRTSDYIDSYVFTKYDKMYMKTIDFHFGSEIEKNVSKSVNTMEAALFSIDKIKEYIEEVEGIEIPTFVAEDIKEYQLDLIIEMDGTLEEYLESTKPEDIKADIQSMYKHYIKNADYVKKH